MADKDLEITNNLEKINWLEDKVNSLELRIHEEKELYKKEVEDLKGFYLQKYADSPVIDIRKDCEKCKKKEELEKEVCQFVICTVKAKFRGR